MSSRSPWRAADATATLALAGGLALGLFWGASPAQAATVLEHDVLVEIGADGTVSERTRIAVRLDQEGDFARWSPYPIFLDENLQLEALAAEVRRPDGEVVRVARRAQDTVEVAGDNILHSSGKVRTVTFPAAPLGAVLACEHTVVGRPYFPAGAVALGGRDAVDRLRVEVRGGGPGWRFRLDGARQEDLRVTPTAGGVVVTAERRPRFEPPDLAPGRAAVEPVLRYSWGSETTWDGVGRWYLDLLRTVPRGAESVRRKARELTAGLPAASAGSAEAARLAALLAFVRREVRYVAVEVGIGGYRPAAPEAVLERRWGDCKDKALLLVDLLQEIGVAAYPVLIRSDDRGRVDPDFPAPDRFNHLIVAVPTRGLALGPALDPAGGEDGAAEGAAHPSPDSPVADGYLFLDATQPAGDLAWLQPGAQDQMALIVRPEGSVLVHTPVRPGQEATTLAIDAEATAAGDLAGTARLHLTGNLGTAYTEHFRASRPEEIEEVLRRTFSSLLPGATFQELRWQASRDGVPRVELTARLRVAGLLQGAGPGGSFQLPGAAATPTIALLDDRKLPVVLTPSEQRLTWTLRFPAPLCPPAGQDTMFDNALGGFRQTVAVADRVLTVERQTRLVRRWVEPADVPALRELALAEQRALKKRIRLACGEAGGGAAAPP